MGKSSIHVRPVSSGSEQHNQREKKLNYVRSDLSHLNSSFQVKSISEAKREILEKYKNSTGQKMQAKATPIREGVLLISEKHTAEDLKNLASSIEERFGIRTIQGYCHKDEGHFDKETKEWKPNYHAHMVFDWTDKNTGKTIKMSREDMGELQTIVAQELNLERGQKSTKKHIESTKFKAIKEEQDLQKVYGFKKGLSEAKTVIEQVSTLKKEIEPLKTAKNALLQETDLTRANLKYLQDKTETQRQELKQIEEQKQKSQGFKR